MTRFKTLKFSTKIPVPIVVISDGLVVYYKLLSTVVSGAPFNGNFI